MTETTDGLKKLHSGAHLVEAILCDDVTYESPRNIVLLRVASRASNDLVEIERILTQIAVEADKRGPYYWRDSMRSHFELAEFHFGASNFAACAADLKKVLEILKHHFSPGNFAMAEMHRLRAICLRKTGCEIGAERDEEIAVWMNRGGRH